MRGSLNVWIAVFRMRTSRSSNECRNLVWTQEDREFKRILIFPENSRRIHTPPEPQNFHPSCLAGEQKICQPNDPMAYKASCFQKVQISKIGPAGQFGPPVALRGKIFGRGKRRAEKFSENEDRKRFAVRMLLELAPESVWLQS